MSEFSEAVATAGRLILSLDSELLEIVGLSLEVSLVSTALAGVIGVSLGAVLAAARFFGREALVVLVNALMGLPPVVVGLAVYLMLSNSGPLGSFQLLYTPAAMIVAQTLLVSPIIAALTRQSIEDLKREYDELLSAFGLGPWQRAATLVYEARVSVLTAMLAGFGRAIAEVGAVMIVGGNINHVTRTMTTAIALETSKGELALAMGLGIVLILLALSVNAAIFLLRARLEPWARVR